MNRFVFCLGGERREERGERRERRENKYATKTNINISFDGEI
jgi:hypothetical protein